MADFPPALFDGFAEMDGLGFGAGAGCANAAAAPRITTASKAKIFFILADGATLPEARAEFQ